MPVRERFLNLHDDDMQGIVFGIFRGAVPAVRHAIVLANNNVVILVQIKLNVSKADAGHMIIRAVVKVIQLLATSVAFQFARDIVLVVV